MAKMKRILVCTVAVLAACGQTQMVKTTGDIRSHMLQGNHQAALSTLRLSKEQGFREQDRVVYWMNEGMLLHLTGQYHDSNKVLHQSEERSKELYTKSISKGIKSAFTSDASTDYSGEDYENVLVNVVKALNFLAMGKVEDALVEARKINEKLSLYNTKYAHKNVYNQDAFAHWLMGLLFELEGSYDDARIAYAKAMDVYKGPFAANYGIRVPSYLKEDLVRASILSGSNEDVATYRGTYGAGLGSSAEALKKMGEVILVHLNGEGPSKSDFFVNCYFQNALLWFCDFEPGGEFMKRTSITVGTGTAIKVAFPQLHVREPANPFITLGIGGASARSEAALPINPIARKTMADKMHRIFKDAVVRVITKYLTTKAAEEVGNRSGGQIFGLIAKIGTSVAMQATEEADKRAWTTLPARIDVARVLVPPGRYTAKITSASGAQYRSIPGIQVTAGKRTVLTYLTLP